MNSSKMGMLDLSKPVADVSPIAEVKMGDKTVKIFEADLLNIWNPEAIAEDPRKFAYAYAVALTKTAMKADELEYGTPCKFVYFGITIK